MSLSDFKYDIGRLVVAVLVMIQFGAVTVYMVMNKIPGSEILIGALAAANGSVIGWWFTSSKGSEQKTRLLAQAEPINLNPDGQPDPTK